MQKISYTEKELPIVAQQLVTAFDNKTLCFHAEMGAGKTTLIKELVKQLEGQDVANSPTFGIVNEYHYKNGELLGYHFDFYRLNNETEALDFGLEDYLYQDVWTFMEWPEKIMSLLPEDAIHIYIEVVNHETRTLQF